MLPMRLYGQPAAPPLPAKYHVQLRYEIHAPRDPHVIMYDAMMDHLLSLGFEFIPPLEKHPETDREDPNKNEVTGLLLAGKILEVFRNRNVVSALLMPADYKLPEMANQPVGVRLELASGLGGARARELSEQALVILRALGFREAIGYDHHGYTGRPFTRLVGTIPAGSVELLLKDLRKQPAGWFAPIIARGDLPAPLRNVSPILVTEVIPAIQPLVEPPLPPARGKEYLDKISPDLWALANAKDGTVVRLEVILAYVPESDESGWRRRLAAAAPSFIVEGHLGQFITGFATASAAIDLAALPDVAVVRLSRPPALHVDASVKRAGDNVRALRQSGLEALHKRNFRGQGVRLAIVDADFRGWTEMVQSKQLPASTRLVDLTRTLNPSLQPDAYPGPAKKIGHGTQCALAVALAAPAAELVLIRIDATPFRLPQVVHHIQGEFLSPDLAARRDELTLARAALRRAREELVEEEKKLAEDFEDYSELDEEYGYLGAIYGWIFNPRVLHQQRKDYQERRQRELLEHADAFRKLVDEVRSLKGIQIVTIALVWNDGYPLGGMSPLSRWFDDLPLSSPLWFQSGGNTRGQSWTGLFRDEDENGVMEFASQQTPLPKGLWTRELNFLGWQPYEGQKTQALPGGAKLRLSVQWREPHDPAYHARPGEEDAYRKPLVPLRLVILRQIDPEGKKLGADNFEIAAYSYGLPQRLDNTPDFGVYEQAVEFTVARPGRYALRVERQRGSRWTLVADAVTGDPIIGQVSGLVATGIRPAGTATLPALEKNWDFRPRFFVDVTDEPNRGLGRPVFLDFATDLGDIGVPADARTLITVGAADLQDRLAPYSAAGPPANLELFRKPNIFAYDSLRLGPEGAGGAYGPSISASFAAGLAASALSSGMTGEQFMEYLRQESGRVLRVPPQ
jgi:hypothetical protein